MKNVRFNKGRKYVVRRRILLAALIIGGFIIHQFITAKLTGRGGLLSVNAMVRFMTGSKLVPLLPR